MTHTFGAKAAISTVPFVATFALLTFLAYRKVYPLLAATAPSKGSAKHDVEPATQILARRIAAITFACTIALSAVLTELLLCEISNSFNPTARSVALQFTVASLLGLLVIAIPILGIASVVSKSGYKFRGADKGRLRLAWVLEIAGYAIFLVGFWTIGNLLPQTKTVNETLKDQTNLFQACLDRLGITGVSFMALLSGFASVSSIWQNFGPKAQIVTESDINRKQVGLEAANDMLAEKKSRLESLERKMMSTAPSQSFWSKSISSLRGNADDTEKQTLHLEISGLETMCSSLENSLSILRAHYTVQQQSATKLGRAQLAFSYTFSCYCVYRIITTLLAILRWTFFNHRSTEGNTSDLITYTIALVARNIYPSLDQSSWTQQISFLLSGAMLLASFSAVTQTFHLFSRLLPSTLQLQTKTNFALLISQISGMYVISSALMLRGMMPAEVGSVINSALGAGLLEPRWVQAWFDGFFMISVIVTAVGIFMGKQIGGSAFDDSTWDNDIEMGKRN
jgi:Abscisic acid G-protein coupled receptor/The Golgi pH Regulator (GPHR) Family N-terminal